MNLPDTNIAHQLVSMPVAYQGQGAVDIMILVDDQTKQMVFDAAANGIARILEVWDYTNILAIGCDLAIVDPMLFHEDEWNCLCEVYSSYVDVQFKMLLVKPNPYKAVMPKRNVISGPIEMTVEFLREQMQRAVKTPKNRAVWEKKERQIQRLMYMLYCLDTSTLRLRNVAERFEISLRTVQRDLEVLLAANYVIEDGDEPGVYRFPKDYRSYQV